MGDPGGGLVGVDAEYSTSSIPKLKNQDLSKSWQAAYPHTYLTLVTRLVVCDHQDASRSATLHRRAEPRLVM